MEAKHMKRVSQAYHGMNMGKIFLKITEAAMIGETQIQVEDEVFSDTAKIYFTGLGYTLDNTSDSITISWG